MVYEYYFRTPINFSENIKSPIRSDLNPGCKFFYDDSGALTLMDYSKGKSYNIISLLSALKSISYKEAKIMIIQDFIYAQKIVGGLNKEEIIIKKRTFDLKVQPRDFTEKELEFWSIGGLNITPEILNNYGIRATSLYILNNVVCASDAYYFTHQYFTQIYKPEADKNARGYEGRYRASTSKGVYNFFDGIPPGKTIITKSFRDAFYLSNLGFDVKFVISEGAKIKASEEDYILFDNDATGIKKAEELKTKYGCKTIYYPLPEKDTVDYLKKYGKEQTINYITECIK